MKAERTQDPVERVLWELEVDASVRDQLLGYARKARHTRRQHVVPASYISAWSGKGGTVAVWDTLEGRVFRAKPRNVCAISDYYTVELTTGEESRFVEGALATVDAAFAEICHRLARDGQLVHAADRHTFAIALAILEARLPQHRRLMGQIATQHARASVGNQLKSKGLDPYGFRVESTTNFHVKVMFDVAAPIAASLAMRDWVLHRAPQPWFVTSDTPLLYDFEQAPPIEVLEQTPIGSEILARAQRTGTPPIELTSAAATAETVLLPLSPYALLEICPEHNGKFRMVAAQARVRRLADRLAVKCRERFVISHPTQDLLRGKEDTIVQRRRQMRFRCVQTSPENKSCTIGTSFVYSREPVVETCGNHP